MGRGRSKAGKTGGGGGSSKSVQEFDGKVVSISEADQFFDDEKFMGSLTDAEKEAIKDYTGSGFESLNNSLRHDWALATSQKETQKNLDSVIAKGVLKEDIRVYRGSSTDLVKGASTVDEVLAMVGEVVTDKGFTSSSITKAGSFKSEPILYRIDVPKGKGRGAYINNGSHFKNHEYEFLLKRGGNYAIKGATKKKSTGQVVVYLQMVD